MTGERTPLTRGDRLASVLDFLEKEGLMLAADGLRVETELEGLPELRVPLDQVFEVFEAEKTSPLLGGVENLPRPSVLPISGRLKWEAQVAEQNPTCVAWGDHDQLVVGTAGRSLVLFSADGNKVHAVQDLPSPVLCVAWRDSLVVVGCMGGELVIFRVIGNSFERLSTITKVHGSSHVLGMEFSASGSWLLSFGRDGCVAIFAVETELSEHGRIRLPGSAAAAAWLSDTQVVVAGSEACEFEIYEISSLPFRMVGKTHMHASLRDRSRCFVSALAVYKQEFFVAAVGKNVHLYRPGVDGPVRSCYGASEGEGPVHVSIADDGAHVYVATSSGLGIYETHSGHRVGFIEGRPRNFARRGDHLATVAFDKKLRIYLSQFLVIHMIASFLLAVSFGVKAVLGTECFSSMAHSRTMQALCCYPVISECFDKENPPDKCCPFTATLPERTCTQGCDGEEIWPYSIDPLIRRDRHYPMLNLYAALAKDPAVHGKCLYEEIIALFYGYMKASEEVEPSLADALEEASLPRLWQSLQTCDLTDEEMWLKSHLTRPLISYMMRHKNHFRSNHSSYAALASKNIIPEGATAWDVGVADGQDTLYLLANGLKKVVMVEASPPTLEYMKPRLAGFGWATVLIERAVIAAAMQQIQPNVSFSFFPRHTQASRLSETTADDHVGFVVPTTNCRSIAEVYGTPWLLKVDVEDVDEDAEQPCLADLCSNGYFPKYVSLETNTVKHVQQLLNCGYTNFKLVPQSIYTLYVEKEGSPKIHRAYRRQPSAGNGTIYQFSSSGPLGEDAIDWVTGHDWRTAEEVAADIDIFNSARNQDESSVLRILVYGSKSNAFEWFDIHAKRD